MRVFPNGEDDLGNLFCTCGESCWHIDKVQSRKMLAQIIAAKNKLLGVVLPNQAAKRKNDQQLCEKRLDLRTLSEGQILNAYGRLS